MTVTIQPYNHTGGEHGNLPTRQVVVLRLRSQGATLHGLFWIEVIEGKLNPAKTRKSPRFDAFVIDYQEWVKANKKPLTI